MRTRHSPVAVPGKSFREGHLMQGTGGTCFSLTATLLYLLRALGWEAEPILADRRYGADTHCALLVWIDRQPHLLDPGYLIVDPIPLSSSEEQIIETAFNRLILTPQGDGEKLALHTAQQKNSTYRLTFKISPVDSREFLRVWDASFEWEMMRYPLLTRIVGERQLYLQGNRFQTRTHDHVERREISAEELIPEIARDFGIDPTVAGRALSILKGRGEPYG